MARHVPVSAFRDRASELIAAAEKGETIVITRHGRPVAELSALAAADAERRSRVDAALAGLEAIRADMRERGQSVTREEVSAWKAEGRR